MDDGMQYVRVRMFAQPDDVTVRLRKVPFSIIYYSRIEEIWSGIRRRNSIRNEQESTHLLSPRLQTKYKYLCEFVHS